jgi:hypothetical protein
MSSCTVFVFLSLIEYAFVNVMMGDISEVERKDKASHLRSLIVTSAAGNNQGISTSGSGFLGHHHGQHSHPVSPHPSQQHLHQPGQPGLPGRSKCPHETEETVFAVRPDFSVNLSDQTFGNLIKSLEYACMHASE